MSLVARDLVAGYVPGAAILNGLSISVADGEIVTVLGPNGSGKSTLVKTIMGYVTPGQGSVVVDGQDLSGLPTHRRIERFGLAYVPQLDNVFGPLTVRENLAVGGHGLPKRSRAERVAQLLERYPQLADRANARADLLSGGQRQVLALARALMTRPRHLLLDEPSAGLSPLLLQELFQMIAKIRAHEGVSVLVVEQNAAQALAVSDRGYVLVQGSVAIAGTAREMLEHEGVRRLYLGGDPAATDEEPPLAPGQGAE